MPSKRVSRASDADRVAEAEPKSVRGRGGEIDDDLYECVEAPFERSMLLVALSRVGVCAVQSPGEEEVLFVARLHRMGLRRREPGCAKAHRRGALRAFESLLRGKGSGDGVALDLRGSDFCRAVWKAVGKVPRGSAATYAAIAKSAGYAGAVRGTAAANRHAPCPLFIPTHRVVTATGRLLLPEADPWSPVRRRVAKLEGIEVSEAAVSE